MGRSQWAGLLIVPYRHAGSGAGRWKLTLHLIHCCSSLMKIPGRTLQRERRFISLVVSESSVPSPWPSWFWTVVRQYHGSQSMWRGGCSLQDRREEGTWGRHNPSDMLPPARLHVLRQHHPLGVKHAKHPTSLAGDILYSNSNIIRKDSVYESACVPSTCAT